MNLKDFFDRVVVINLDRRTDRLEGFYRRCELARWPFRWPERFAAIDGQAIDPPVWWTKGRGPWACRLSHREVLTRALADGVQRLLVLEDDCAFAPSQGVLAAMPADFPSGATFSEIIATYGDDALRSDLPERAAVALKAAPSSAALLAFGGDVMNVLAKPAFGHWSKLMRPKLDSEVAVMFVDHVTGAIVQRTIDAGTGFLQNGGIAGFHCYAVNRVAMQIIAGATDDAHEVDCEIDILGARTMLDAREDVLLAAPTLAIQTYADSDNRLQRATRYTAKTYLEGGSAQFYVTKASGAPRQATIKVSRGAKLNAAPGGVFASA